MHCIKPRPCALDDRTLIILIFIPMIIMHTGNYILRCRTALHTDSGMQSLFTVAPSAAATAAAKTLVAPAARGSLVSRLASMSQVHWGCSVGIWVRVVIF